MAPASSTGAMEICLFLKISMIVNPGWVRKSDIRDLIFFADLKQ
jgi:hypothetical protein